jgi:indolepyruvate ferredoxin oxidoreductase alpha subunit
VGIIVAGVSYTYVQEAFYRSPAYTRQIALCKLGAINPLPRAELRDFLCQVDVVLVLEELEPMIETEVLALIAEMHLDVDVLGKRNGLLPRVGDYTLVLVEEAIKRAMQKQLVAEAVDKSGNESADGVALPRTLEFCPGCPHRMTYYALNRAIERLGFTHDEIIVTGDIGCTIIGIHAPLNVCWTEVSMGASIGIAQGFKYAGIEKPVIAAMGDGTFYHNGVAGLLNAVQAGVDLTLLILDNSTSAMTGLQPDAGSGKRATGEPSAQADIAMIVRGCGVTSVKEVDPYHLADMIDVLQEAISYAGVAVVIAKAPCTTQGVLINEYPVQVDQNICRAGAECQDTPCYAQVGCPSVLLQRETGKEYSGDSCHASVEKKGYSLKVGVTIDTATCVACGLCVAACPFEAILPLQG